MLISVDTKGGMVPKRECLQPTGIKSGTTVLQSGVFVWSLGVAIGQVQDKKPDPGWEKVEIS